MLHSSIYLSYYMISRKKGHRHRLYSVTIQAKRLPCAGNLKKYWYRQVPYLYQSHRHPAIPPPVPFCPVNSPPPAWKSFSSRKRCWRFLVIASTSLVLVPRSVWLFHRKQIPVITHKTGHTRTSLWAFGNRFFIWRWNWSR